MEFIWESRVKEGGSVKPQELSRFREVYMGNPGLS